MEFIKRRFIKHPKQDQDGAGDSNRQAGYIYKRVESVLPKVADAYQKVVLQHGKSFNLCLPAIIKKVTERVVIIQKVASSH
jgi:hypothetical protein